MKKLGLVSLCTVGGIFLLLAVILIVIFAICGVPIYVALIISFIFILLQFLIGPWITDLTMKWFYKVDFTYEIPQYLKTFIEDTCKENKMKYPKIGFINDGAPNAFTYGRVKSDARIVLTKGIFDLLSEEEVKAVVAHEIGHVVHYDMLVMTVAQTIPLLFLGIANALLRTNTKSSSKSSSSGKSDGQGAVVIVALVCLLIYIISEYVILWLSRTREYYADDFSADVTKSPESLSSALVKIGFGLSTAKLDETKKHHAGDTTTLGISDKDSSQAMTACACSIDGEVSKTSIKKAMRWDLWNFWAKWYEINSTHPLISKRILKLSDKAVKEGKEPYIIFDEKKEKSYAGQFFSEALLCITPVVLLIAAIVMFFVVIAISPQQPLFIIPAAIALVSILLSIFKFIYRHPKNFKDETVESMMERIEVSNMKAVPCKLTGNLIGRGDPGCIFNENFVLLDETGIVLLNYKQPLKFWDKIFALFGSKNYLNKDVEVKGWFRRSPVPYIDMLEFKVGDKTKKLYSYIFGWVWRIIIAVLLLILAIITLI